jgi:hypothetical protein
MDTMKSWVSNVRRSGGSNKSNTTNEAEAASITPSTNSSLEHMTPNMIKAMQIGRGAMIGGNSVSNQMSSRLAHDDGDEDEDEEDDIEEVSIAQSSRADLERGDKDEQFTNNSHSSTSTGRSWLGEKTAAVGQVVHQAVASVASSRKSVQDPYDRINLSPHARDYEKPRPKRRYVLSLALVSVVLIAAIIAVSILVFGNHTQTINSTAATSSREQALDAVLTTITDAKALFSNASSPQFRARNWLLYDDKYVPSANGSVSDDQVIQRYVLALFYFSTSGLSAWSNNTWMNGNECEPNNEWTGIACTLDGKVRTIAFGE